MARRYVTEDYVCGSCDFTVRVRVAAPAGGEHHRGYFRQGIDPKDCFRCRLRKQLAACSCMTCLEAKETADGRK